MFKKLECVVNKMWRLAALNNQLMPVFLSYNTRKPHNPNQNKSMLPCFPENFDFQKHSTPIKASHYVCHPCWPLQAVKIRFSNMCVSWNKGKHILMNQAKYFVVQPCFKNKLQHLPFHAPPFPKECTQHPSSSTYLAEPNHTWHFPYTQLQACFQRALWNSGTTNNVPFSPFLGAELQSSSALCNCQPSLPQHKSISIYCTL